jgi:molybdate transport system substrate-binding protein
MPRTLLLLALLLPGCHRGERRGAPRDITVFVAASLVPAFQELADTMHARDPALIVRLNGAASSSLVSQLELGGRADLLATADAQWMQIARDKRLAGDATAIATSSLAVVVSTKGGASAVVRSPLNLASPGVRVVLAGPDVPLGRYSRQLLDRLAAGVGYGSDFPARVQLGVISQELSAAGVMSKLRLGEADAGIIYRSQLLEDSSGTVRELSTPGARTIVASYYLAMTTSPIDSLDAVRFMQLVTSATGRAVLQRHGFELPVAGAGQ